MLQRISSNGLNNFEVKLFLDLIIKSNDEQLEYLLNEVEDEISKRYCIIKSQKDLINNELKLNIL